MSLLVLERGMDGFERGRNLDKIGLHSQDTAELFFTDVQVPVANLLGTEGQGFTHLVHEPPAGAAVDRRGRRGRRRGGARLDADVRQGAPGVRSADRRRSRTAGSSWPRWRTEIEIARSSSTVASRPSNDGDAHRRGGRHGQVVVHRVAEARRRRCVQLHGGYGYMLEYPIARAYVDARITTIYGGTTEIMKEIIGRALGV